MADNEQTTSGATAPTARGTLQLAKTTYISWGTYNFELTGSNVYRPALPGANETEVISNVKTYKSYTPKDGLEPMTIHVIYDPTTWAALRALKEAGTIQTLETSDGFSAPALISEMPEVSANVDEPISDMPITFAFPPASETEGSGSGETGSGETGN